MVRISVYFKNICFIHTHTHTHTYIWMYACICKGKERPLKDGGKKKAQINLSRGLIFIIYILGQYMIIMITTKCKLQ